MTEIERLETLGASWYADACALIAATRRPTCPLAIVGWSLGWFGPNRASGAEPVTESGPHGLDGSAEAIPRCPAKLNAPRDLPVARFF